MSKLTALHHYHVPVNCSVIYLRGWVRALSESALRGATLGSPWCPGETCLREELRNSGSGSERQSRSAMPAPGWTGLSRAYHNAGRPCPLRSIDSQNLRILRLHWQCPAEMDVAKAPCLLSRTLCAIGFVPPKRVSPHRGRALDV